jgi:hypothetical protein
MRDKVAAEARQLDPSPRMIVIDLFHGARIAMRQVAVVRQDVHSNEGE